MIELAEDQPPLLHQCGDFAVILGIRPEIHDFRDSAVRQHIGAGPTRLIRDVNNRSFAIDPIREQQQILLGMNRSNAALLLDHPGIGRACLYGFELFHDHAARFRAILNSHWSPVIRGTEQLLSLNEHRSDMSSRATRTGGNHKRDVHKIRIPVLAQRRHFFLPPL